MNDKEELLDWIDDRIPILEGKFLEILKDQAYYRRGKIFLDTSLSYIQQKEVVVEEYGHFRTTIGVILDQSVQSNRKQEAQARKLGYELAITLDDIIQCKYLGFTYYWECAEYLNYSPEFVYNVVQHYKTKYGTSFVYKNFQINFSTASTMEIINLAEENSYKNCI